MTNSVMDTFLNPEVRVFHKGTVLQRTGFKYAINLANNKCNPFTCVTSTSHPKYCELHCGLALCVEGHKAFLQYNLASYSFDLTNDSLLCSVFAQIYLIAVFFLSSNSFKDVLV